MEIYKCKSKCWYWGLSEQQYVEYSNGKMQFSHGFGAIQSITSQQSQSWSWSLRVSDTLLHHRRLTRCGCKYHDSRVWTESTKSASQSKYKRTSVLQLMLMWLFFYRWNWTKPKPSLFPLYFGSDHVGTFLQMDNGDWGHRVRDCWLSE